MAKVKEDQGAAGSDGDYTSLSSFVAPNIASSPSGSASSSSAEIEERSLFEKVVEDPFTPSGTIDAVVDSAGDVLGDVSVDSVTDAVGISEAKSLVSGALDDPSALVNLDLDTIIDVASGDLDPKALLKTSKLSALSNALTGTDCTSVDLDPVKKELFNSLLKDLWSLPDSDGFFDCLVDDLKSMGAGFVNSIMDNTLEILGNTAMDGLIGAGSVLGAEALDYIPGANLALSVYDGKPGATDEENADRIGNALGGLRGRVNEPGPDWTERVDGSLDLDTFAGSSETAKRAMSVMGSPKVEIGLATANMFGGDLDSSDPQPSMALVNV